MRFYRKNFNANPVWGVKVLRLKKVKARLKKFIRKKSKFTNKMKEIINM